MNQPFCMISESFSIEMYKSPRKYTGNVFKVYHYLKRISYFSKNKPGEQGIATISYDTMCHDLGFSRATISNALKFLCAEGWIQKKKKIGHVNEYIIFATRQESARFREEQRANTDRNIKEKEERKLKKQQRARKEQERKEHEVWFETATPEERTMIELYNQTKQNYQQSKHTWLPRETQQQRAARQFAERQRDRQQRIKELEASAREVAARISMPEG